MPPEQAKRSTRRSRKTAATVSPSGQSVKQLPLPPPFAAPQEEHGRGAGDEPVRVLTIGHGNQEGAAFVSLLRQHGVATLVDMRSAPYSRYVPNFSQGALRWLVDDAGVRYLWAGDLLGGRPTDPVCYRDGIVRPGNVDYEVVARQPWYQEGIVQLLTVAQGGATAMMCSEEDPRRCHRHRLIEPSLRERGVTVVHIRGDGNLEMIDSAAHDDAVVTSPQMVLALFEFGE
jgi:uncharacterized protein (DUF488 family)